MRLNRLLRLVLSLIVSLSVVGLVRPATAQTGGPQEGFFVNSVGPHQAIMSWHNSPYNLLNTDAVVTFYDQNGGVLLGAQMLFSRIEKHGNVWDYYWVSTFYDLVPEGAKFVSGTVTSGDTTYNTYGFFELWRTLLPALLKRYTN